MTVDSAPTLISLAVVVAKFLGGSLAACVLQFLCRLLLHVRGLCQVWVMLDVRSGDVFIQAVALEAGLLLWRLCRVKVVIAFSGRGWPAHFAAKVFKLGLVSD